MEFIIAQGIVFIVMAVYGILLGFFYTVYKQMNLNHSWITNCLDIFIPLVLGSAAFLLLLYTNRGEFRFFVIIAIVMGFILSKNVLEKIKK